MALLNPKEEELKKAFSEYAEMQILGAQEVTLAHVKNEYVLTLEAKTANGRKMLAEMHDFWTSTENQSMNPKSTVDESKFTVHLDASDPAKAVEFLHLKTQTYQQFAWYGANVEKEADKAMHPGLYGDPLSKAPKMKPVTKSDTVIILNRAADEIYNIGTEEYNNMKRAVRQLDEKTPTGQSRLFLATLAEAEMFKMKGLPIKDLAETVRTVASLYTMEMNAEATATRLIKQSQSTSKSNPRDRGRSS